MVAEQSKEVSLDHEKKEAAELLNRLSELRGKSRDGLTEEEIQNLLAEQDKLMNKLGEMNSSYSAMLKNLKKESES